MLIHTISIANYILILPAAGCSSITGTPPYFPLAISTTLLLAINGAPAAAAAATVPLS